MSKYYRNEGETTAQFNARITASEKAEAERMASRKPKVRNEVAEQQLGQAQPTAYKRTAADQGAIDRYTKAVGPKLGKMFGEGLDKTRQKEIDAATLTKPTPTKPTLSRPDNWFIAGPPGSSGGLSGEYMDYMRKREEAEYQARIASGKYPDAKKPASNSPAPNDGGPADPKRGVYSPEQTADANAILARPRTSQPMSKPDFTKIEDYRPMAKGGSAKKGVVKKAAGGAAKVRKGMMTSEDVITNAMNNIRKS